MRTAPKPDLRKMVAEIEEQTLLACQRLPWVAVKDLRDIITLAMTQGVELQRAAMLAFEAEPDTVKIRRPT